MTRYKALRDLAKGEFVSIGRDVAINYENDTSSIVAAHLDDIVHSLRSDGRKSREISLAITQLQQARMWLEEDARINGSAE